ncbi:hypothetical protein CEXT_627951 [Caerostris extrusa]|uniref:Uncharacterized protein n=1 Tax=Caerostris extrusa TaxID=172846 RepID=A0AAV4WEC7_CAEEX|nr:hypothetical protein CEXT_627951 [Caerostris extrusa]
MKITFSSPGRIRIPLSLVKMPHRDREGDAANDIFRVLPPPLDSSRNVVCPVRVAVAVKTRFHYGGGC